MKTLAQLKRDLQVGMELECLFHFIPERKDNKRVITKVNTVGIQFEKPFLDFLFLIFLFFNTLSRSLLPRSVATGGG